MFWLVLPGPWFLGVVGGEGRARAERVARRLRPHRVQVARVVLAGPWVRHAEVDLLLPAPRNGVGGRLLLRSLRATPSEHRWNVVHVRRWTEQRTKILTPGHLSRCACCLYLTWSVALHVRLGFEPEAVLWRGVEDRLLRFLRAVRQIGRAHV